MTYDPAAPDPLAQRPSALRRSVRWTALLGLLLVVAAWLLPLPHGAEVVMVMTGFALALVSLGAIAADHYRRTTS